MSLGLGSLLGYLGSMLRWPLLARATYKPQDVDFILGMVSPTGALRLVFRHIRQRKWTRTTSIVAAYIFVNVAGRLSVAIFGLTFNLPDESGIEYPHQVTDWNAAKDPWMASRNISCYSEFTSNADRLMDHAQTGLRNFATTLNITYTLNDMMLSQLEQKFMMSILSNLSNITLDIDHNDNTVRYSYALKEYHGPTSTSSNVTVHSSASCNAITIEGDKVHHWGDNKTTYINFSMYNMPCNFTEDYLSVLSVLLWRYNVSYDTTYKDYIWAVYPGYSFFHQPNYIPEFFSTYIFNSNKRAANNTALAELWECRSRLTHGENRTGISGFYNIADADTPSYVKSLLSFSAVGSDWWVNRTAVLLRSYYALFVIRENPSYGIWSLSEAHLNRTTLKYSGSINSKACKRYAAGLVARLPILAIATADTILPKANKGNSTTKTGPYVRTLLEVKWKYVGATMGSIIGGQMLAIIIVLYYCRDVFIRDDSYLSTARLLKTTMERIEHGSLGTGPQLAKYFDDLGLQMKYGTKSIEDTLVVDLSDDLDPERRFPHDREYEEIPGFSPKRREN